jgi:hypothetical protein
MAGTGKIYVFRRLFKVEQTNAPIRLCNQLTCQPKTKFVVVEQRLLMAGDESHKGTTMTKKGPDGTEKA